MAASPHNHPSFGHLPSMTLRVAHRSDVGCVRSVNEDSYLVIEPRDPLVLASRGKLLVVADGMGGTSGGDKASRLVIKATKEAYYDDEVDLKVSESLVRSVRHANQVIMEYARQNPAYHGMGSTCTAVALHGRQAHFAHVGDSRLYLIRDHRVLQLTDDHSKVAQMVRDGRLSREQASTHPERNVIMRWLGTHPDLKIDAPPHPLDLLAGDRLLICSDGLTSHVGDVELLRYVDQRDPTQAVNRLVELAKARGGSDNITVVLVQIVQVVSPAARELRAPVISEPVSPIPLTQPSMSRAERDRQKIQSRLWVAVAVLMVMMVGAAIWLYSNRDDKPADSASAQGGDSAEVAAEADKPDKPDGPSLAAGADAKEQGAQEGGDPQGAAVAAVVAPPSEGGEPSEAPAEPSEKADKGEPEGDGKEEEGAGLFQEKVLQGFALQKAVERVEADRGPMCNKLRLIIAEKLAIPSEPTEAFVQGVASYQKRNKIQVVGHPGPQTRSHIFGTDIRWHVCQKGMSLQEIEQLEAVKEGRAKAGNNDGVDVLDVLGGGDIPPPED